MTIEEAKRLGYKIIVASSCEVGLVRNDKGVRTWFCTDFNHKLPSLDHPEIQKAIYINERCRLTI